MEYPSGWTCEVTIVRLERYVVESLPRREMLALLIATPEYNDGIPGVLTTAIDWGSRPPGAAPLTGKPVALMGASPSQVGTARAQLHLRQLLGHVHARTLPGPSSWWRRRERFDRELRPAHEGTRRVLAALLKRFARWIDRERAADAAARALAPPASVHR
ncbi:MAG TPA: NAD(P)H-dependent oxidoreductase [Gemmatimonadales bacterium]|nr:NAD(P)H-dependent oxidoreductase [Gemmatimonadales bacterium]